MWATSEEIARRVGDDLLARGPVIRERLRSSRGRPTVVIGFLGVGDDHGQDGAVTEKYILLKEGRAERLLVHELVHYYSVNGPLQRLPHMVEEGIAYLVGWDESGFKRYSLELPSEMAVELALTATRDQAQSWGTESYLYRQVMIAACWIASTFGLEELQSLCANAPDDDPGWMVNALRERLPSLQDEPRRASFEVNRF